MRIYSSQEIKEKLIIRNKIKKVLNILYYVLVGFLVILSIAAIYQKYIKKSNSVSLFGYTSYVVVSGSMQPKFNIGDIIVVVKTAEDKIANGDIITFYDENKNVITHRVVDIIIQDGQKKFQTKGDNNNSNDTGLVIYQNIKGKYCFKLSQAGRIMDIIFTPIGLLFLALIIVLIYFNSSRLSDRKIARHAIRERYKKQNGKEE